MPPVNLDTLRDHCAGRITAEVLGAPSFQEVEVGGAPRLFAETGSGGTGNNAVWVESSWLIDLSTCDAVVLDINGSRRSSERWTSFRGAGSTEERDWLLRKAG